MPRQKFCAVQTFLLQRLEIPADRPSLSDGATKAAAGRGGWHALCVRPLEHAR
jgi:hypothetical protein